MIDTRFALKYPMPHSVVHIVDNSGAANNENYIEATDPSLLSTLVVTGAPMGEDNTIITLTRSDIASASFGLGNITPYDIKKYGQSVTYVQDLISQNVPVKFMRITPEDSTYATVSLVVQWRKDDADDKLHVRFVLKEWPETLIRDNFKNTSKLNDALNNAFKRDDEIDSNGNKWSQRGFINFIAAGRGGEYNNMATAINMVSQARRPTNVRYEFVTFDTRTNVVIERFYASLMNQRINNFRNPNGIDPVNTIVNKRVPGSSIIVPYLNESAVVEIYDKYTSHLKEMIEKYPKDEFASNVYKAMNINIFDLIFGNYIYNGTDANTKMPYYQVDMISTDIPSLDESKILCDVVKESTDTWDKKTPDILFNKLKASTAGVAKADSALYVGDMILVPPSENSNSYPKISLVTSVNQYSGTVTTMVIPKLYPLGKEKAGTEGTTREWDKLDIPTGEGSKSTSRIIYKCIDDLVPTTLTSATIGKDLAANIIPDQSIVAAHDEKKPKEYRLFTIEVTTGSDGTRSYTLHEYPPKLMYKALDRQSHSGGLTGTGNAFGFDDECAAWYRIGAAKVIYGGENGDGEPKIFVNGYKHTSDNPDLIEVSRAVSNRYGSVAPQLDDVTNLSGENFDVKVYTDAYIDEWRIDNLSIVDGGEGYSEGDIVYVDLSIEGETTTNAKTVLKVTEVNEGAVVGFEITKHETYDSNQKGAFSAKDLTEIPTANITIKGGADQATGLKVRIEEFWVTKGNSPREICRYVVSGSFGSLSTILNTYISVPANYYNADYGINPTTEHGGMRLSGGDAGFFDKTNISSIEYKWNYSKLLVDALRGGDNFDKRILSPIRVPAKFMFDAGFNTLYGSTIVTNITAYQPADIINSSSIFTDDEKDEVLFTPEVIKDIKNAADIDVKQAMYDLMIHRCYDGIPEDKRPIGPGSGFQVHFDSGVTDSQTTSLVRESFLKRFDNPNASWDIGGFVDIETGISYTFTKHLVEDMFRHIYATSINKPYAGNTTSISKDRYTSFFPDLDATDWGKREQLYTSGGNAWILQRDGSLQRRSQRTLLRDSETSDLLQENNMRTLSRLIYLLQGKIDSYLLEYNSDSVLKSLQDEVNNMFSNWVGNLVDGLDIQFERDKNIDGGDILVCYCNVTFRGLILRVPIIVNVNKRTN